ncbi:MAG: phosphoethanolamine--lipid A transferase [Pseudomonadota bacterium]
MKLSQPLPTFRIGISSLILLISLCATLLYNLAFFRNTMAVFTIANGGLPFLISLGVFLFALTVLLFSVLCLRYATKPVLILVILGAAFANYFMNSFNVVIDTNMINNIVLTDSGEVADLLNPGMLAELFLLGIVPAFVILRTRIDCSTFGKAIRDRLKLQALALVLIVVSIAPFTSYYTSFFREHKILRYYANPATFIYSTAKYLEMTFAEADATARSLLGLDARIPATDNDRELVILVIGEAARADRFSLNGYKRKTNPLLEQENVISFTNVTSCGTATAYSVPCMFSGIKREDFDLNAARTSENLLDVLQHAGVNVLWRDNNSDSKGVTEATAFESFKSPDTNSMCDDECRDIGMLNGLDDFIAAKPNGDIVIVLHQMGNHGPAYAKRYPADFERFTPACHSSQLENCSKEEIGNAYDNAILYTDYFLSEVIRLLEGYDDKFETAMYYMSDHGESLGENGLYLHGLPWLLAPDTQKHVASLVWFGNTYMANREAIKARADDELSHDNYFHTVLGLLEIQTEMYDPTLDLIVHKGEAERPLGEITAD